MYTSEVTLRVRYGETDQMGFVYYGHYAHYFEVARVETLRALGWTYKKMEEDGVMLPVSDFSIRYLKPAYYDDEITIRTSITELPTVRLRFSYETFNANGELLNTAETTLVFIDKSSGKPTRPPGNFVKALEGYFRSR